MSPADLVARVHGLRAGRARLRRPARARMPFATAPGAASGCAARLGPIVAVEGWECDCAVLRDAPAPRIVVPLPS